MLDIIKGWFTTITDILRSFAMEASTYHTDNDLSNELSAMFKNTCAEVIIFDSNIPSRARLIRLMDKIHNTLFSAERA